MAKFLLLLYMVVSTVGTVYLELGILHYFTGFFLPDYHPTNLVELFGIFCIYFVLYFVTTMWMLKSITK